MEMCYILIMVVFTQLYIFGKTVNLKSFLFLCVNYTFHGPSFEENHMIYHTSLLLEGNQIQLR